MLLLSEYPELLSMTTKCSIGYSSSIMGHCGHGCMLVGFTTT